MWEPDLSWTIVGIKTSSVEEVNVAVLGAEGCVQRVVVEKEAKKNAKQQSPFLTPANKGLCPEFGLRLVSCLCERFIVANSVLTKFSSVTRHYANNATPLLPRVGLRPSPEIPEQASTEINCFHRAETPNRPPGASYHLVSRSSMLLPDVLFLVPGLSRKLCHCGQQQRSSLPRNRIRIRHNDDFR